MTQPADIESLWAQVKTDDQGLAPCVTQDLRTRAVLMVAWVSKHALARSVETGFAVYYSRSRQQLWEKGAFSGNRQRIVHIRLDSDGDTLLYLVDARLPAGNDGSDTYFNYRLQGGGWVWDPIQLQRPDLPSGQGHDRPAILDVDDAALGPDSGSEETEPPDAKPRGGHEVPNPPPSQDLPNEPQPSDTPGTQGAPPGPLDAAEAPRRAPPDLPPFEPPPLISPGPSRGEAVEPRLPPAANEPGEPPRGGGAAAAKTLDPIDSTDPDVILRNQTMRFLATDDPTRSLSRATDLLETLTQRLKARGISLRRVLLNLEARMKLSG